MGHTSSKISVDQQLTVYDLELIKICWDSVIDKEDLGLRIMVR